MSWNFREIDFIGKNQINDIFYLANNGHVNNVNTDEIKSQPWYFGTISRAECDAILTEKGMDGDYMIRESETNVCTYILGMIFKKKNSWNQIISCALFSKKSGKVRGKQNAFNLSNQFLGLMFRY